ncbi:MAG: hypothetical protein IBX44_08165 [Sulfurospirillum sp.]|nr:hypothetical protein [Sulfurospirillum sp.]
MTFEKAWIEYDYNPFIVFDADRKIISLNKEAQYLTAHASIKEIYELVQTYASHTYGFKTSIIDLNFGSFKFYAITVGYNDENQIGIKLYKVPTKKFTSMQEHGEMLNIYALLDLCISVAATRCDAKFVKEFDPTLPDIRIKIDSFTKLLDKIYQSYATKDSITTKLSLVTGEYIRYNDKKYPIFAITIKARFRDASMQKTIEENALKSNCAITMENEATIITSALVSS